MATADETPIFTQEFIDELFARLGPEVSQSGVSKDELADALARSVKAATAQFELFLPASNPPTIDCKMPYNNHTFKNTGQAKTCSSCSFTYCDQHKLTHCVNCGTKL